MYKFPLPNAAFGKFFPSGVSSSPAAAELIAVTTLPVVPASPAAFATVAKPTSLLSAAAAIEVATVFKHSFTLPTPSFAATTNPTGVLSSSVAIEIATVSNPMCLLSGSVVAANGVALNPTVAADVMDAGERISALLLISVDFSCLVSSCRAVCIADAGEGICVPLLLSALMFSFAVVCIAEAGEKIGSLRLLSASLSAARFPSAAVGIADAGEGICVPLSPSALFFIFTAVCIAEAGEKIGSLRLLSASLSAALFPAAVCISDAGEGICVPLSPSALLFSRSVVVRCRRLHCGGW